MELFWKGKYTAAIAKFQEVKNLYPQHAETDKLIQDAQEKKTRFGDTVDPTPVPTVAAVKAQVKKSGTSGARTAAIGVLALAGLGAAAGAVVLVQQNRKRRGPTAAGPASLPGPQPGSYNTPWPVTPAGPANGYQQTPGYGQPAPTDDVQGAATAPRQQAAQSQTPAAYQGYPVAPPPGPSNVASTVEFSRGGTCGNCGASLRAGSQFCSGCGARFGS
jgi:hypothetical protein